VTLFYRSGISFVAVHDCFWTHACSVDEMNKVRACVCLSVCSVRLYIKVTAVIGLKCSRLDPRLL